MCLEILPIQKKRHKPRIVYKFYNRADSGKKNTVSSYYRYDTYNLKRGEFIESGRPSKELSYHEKLTGQINIGFHVYTILLDVKDKINEIKWDHWGEIQLVIAKFEGMPEDFVARGTFHKKPSEVYTRLKFIKFIEYNSYALSRIQ